MRNEIKFILTFVFMFGLGAAAPIALNGGSASPFDGGTITSQLLGPAGTPYTHSAESGLGVGRSGTATMMATVDPGLSMALYSTTSYAQVYWDTNLTDTSTDVNNPAVIGTDADTGIIAQSRAMDFVWNGDAFAGIRTTGGGTLLGGFCLDASNTAPCLVNYPVGNGKLFFSTINATPFTGTMDLGDDGSIKSYSTGYYFDPDNLSTFSSTVDTQFAFANYDGSTTANSVLATATTVGSGHSSRMVQLSTSAGAPTAGDCDADAERGRLVVDTTNSRLYVCGGATRLWDYYTLIDDGAI